MTDTATPTSDDPSDGASADTAVAAPGSDTTSSSASADPDPTPASPPWRETPDYDALVVELGIDPTAARRVPALTAAPSPADRDAA